MTTCTVQSPHNELGILTSGVRYYENLLSQIPTNDSPKVNINLKTYNAFLIDFSNTGTATFSRVSTVK
jgi:hypothetical protein